MALARLITRAIVGVESPPVMVEVHLSGGLPSMTIVGMAETAVKESRDRVRSALLNAQFDFPARRITVNLAPADLPKGSGRYDLAIALGILVASDQLPAASLERTEVMGELALGGELRPVVGALPAAVAARAAGRRLLIPAGNAPDVAMLAAVDVVAAEDLLVLCGHLRGHAPLPRLLQKVPECHPEGPDLVRVKGQPLARQGLEIAAAGGHNLLFFGPPGTGKTLLASSLPSLLPTMTEQEALEVAAIQSITGQPVTWGIRPFRAPHHTTSGVALVGGGGVPRPGEITLAHQGVLFLDELTEFHRATLDVLREPLESGEIHLSRAARKTRFPAQFQLVAAMNPTPSGYAASDARSQSYSSEQLRRYMNRLSGPLLDRIDLYIEVPAVPAEVLYARTEAESSAQVQRRVQAAWQRQMDRQGCRNHHLSAAGFAELGVLRDAEQRLLIQMSEKLGFSARAQHRIQRIALTLADLAQADWIEKNHLMMAVQLRQLDRLRHNQ
jgi:magnesium chelatase family protein